MNSGLRIGIFGGTFNPFHNGHLICAESVSAEFSLDRVLFVPSRIPVHKELDFNVSGPDRAEIIRRSIAGRSSFSVYEDELVRAEDSYSYITVERIKDRNPGADLFFIIGTDAFNGLDKWKHPEKISTAVFFVVLRRDGEIINKKLANWAGNVLLSSNEEIKISSSILRSRINDIDFLKRNMNSDAVDYIVEKGLYRVK
ncbi:MAG: nicotinate (nicotinamide) nucleotide adenylyltransferase [Spirochaetes bacterium]|nr:nicotinate (nicotinamide) nucleotide adenylyltransferase [Spirochaetota bacterium]